MFFKLRELLLSVVCLLMLLSCSSSDDKEETGIIEKTTDKIAQDAIRSIKTPIEQAKLAKEIQDKHNQRVQEAIDKQ